MGPAITDYVRFLADARDAVYRLNCDQNTAAQLADEEEHQEQELETANRAVADAVNQTVKKRLDEINSSYDKEIAKGQERLKKARAKREKAKNKGMKERIAEETSELREHNRELKLQMKTAFQQDRVPRFCKSTWYYSLYFTRGFSEFLILLVTILICFLAVPWGIYMLLPQKSNYYLAGIYFVAVVVFGGLYILINNKTKVRHQETLKQGRKIRDLMRTNDKKIRVITSAIRRDRDEAVYDLEKYDDEIAQIEQDLADITSKKKEALNTFEKVTKTIISDEIAGGSREKIERLEADLRRASDEAKEAEVKVKEQTLFITDNYESYLGTEFMVPEKLDELADFIRLGKAATISEAEALYKSVKG